jgi:hypothetical protein
MKVVRRGEIALGQLVHTRVLEVPDRTGLADELAVKADDARRLAHDLGVPADLAFRGGALFIGHVSGKWELGDFAHRRWR